ncbi:MAG: right-handed parallel beta-helix repeat-containing protein [Deltaproteobacteria bacterium]|nr:right-handed parallel beta-helix repeat-containing protein [Deltaproteobacteria bacterium]MBM4321966.1 right-handed parallel beta-helix repeat-containing protein [Deltaproteobacteria bacterium]
MQIIGQKEIRLLTIETMHRRRAGVGFANVFFIVCIVAFLSSVQISVAADWYLYASARGQNDGTSWSDAWTSPANIVQNKLQPGDTLWIQGGNYTTNLSFTDRHGITVRIAPNATQPAVFTFFHVYNCDGFTIDGLLKGFQMIQFTRSEPSLGHAVNLRQSKPITVRGLLIDRGSEYAYDTVQQHGIRVWDNSGKVIIDSCIVKNTTGDGINITQIDYSGADNNDYEWILISNCTIMNVGDDGIQAGSNHNITVRDCHIDKNRFPTYFGGHPDGFQLNPDGYKVKIYNNTFRGFNQNVFIEYALNDIFIYNNIFIGISTIGTDRAINHSVRDNFSGTFLVANNIMYNFLTFMACNGGFPRSTVIGNNIFVNCRLLTSKNGAFLDATNIYWDFPRVQYYDSNGNPVTSPSDRFAGNSRYCDPKFASLDTFKLDTSSPCIGAGKNLNSYFTYDRAGVIRGTIWDVGPYNSVGLSAPKNLRIIP